MHNGARRVIPDRETFTSMRLSVETIQIVPEWGLAWIPLGPPIPRGSTSLSLQTPAPPQGGSARPQITPAPPGTASALPPARTVPDDQVASAPLGSPVQAIAQPAPTTTRAPPKPTPAAAPSPAPQATAAARVARQPEGAPLEGELYTGPQPLCGDFLRHTGPQINGKCVPNNVVSCQGYRNVFTGGFVNIDWQMSVLDNKHVIGIRIRADNGRHNLIRVCLGATATGRLGI